MNCSFSKNKKAAAVCAAFLFFSPAIYAAKTDIPGFSGIRQKATELLLQKKKSEALQLIINYSRTPAGQPYRSEAGELLVNIAQKFIHRDAQEAYENSLNLTLENPKESVRSNDQCLALEPLQLDCLIQKMRLHTRSGNSKSAADTLDIIRAHVPGSRVEFWLNLQAQRGAPDFKSRQILKTLPENGGDEVMALAILELERAFAAKNYSRAKDLIHYFEKKYADWPEIIFYKQKIDAESAENGNSAASPQISEQILVYKNKCKSLSKTTARKYRYDFNLCLRATE